MDDNTSFLDTVNDVVTSQIGRVVAFVLGPILLIAVPPVTNAINEVFGLGFSDQQISNVVIAIVVGVALLGYKWLQNRGAYERSVLELHKLYEAGNDLAAQQASGGTVTEAPPRPVGTVSGKPGEKLS